MHAIQHIIDSYYHPAIIDLAKNHIRSGKEAMEVIIEFDLYPVVKEILFRRKDFNQLCAYAAFSGDLDDLRLWYATKCWSPVVPTLCATNRYVKFDDISALRWFVDNKYYIHDDAINKMATGRVDQMMKIMELGLSPSKSAFVAALEAGNMPMVNFLSEMKLSTRVGLVNIRQIAKNGHTEALKYVLDHKLVDFDKTDNIIECKTIECAELLHKHGYLLEDTVFIHFLEEDHNNLPWILSFSGFKLTITFIESVITWSRKLDTLEVIIDIYISDGHKLDSSLYAKAVYYGRLNMLKVLLANDCPIPSDTVKLYHIAIEYGYIEILDWLYDNKFEYDETVFDVAIHEHEYGTKVLNWLADHKFPHKNLMEAAILCEKLSVIKWVHRRGIPYDKKKMIELAREAAFRKAVIFLKRVN